MFNLLKVMINKDSQLGLLRNASFSSSRGKKESAEGEEVSPWSVCEKIISSPS